MTKSTSTLSGFFREDAKEIQGILKEGDSKEVAVEPSVSVTTDPPTFPKVDASSEEELSAWLRNLRAFFRSGKGGGLPSGKKSETAFPALLASYRDRDHIRNDYPFWMADEKSVETDNHCTSLSNLLIRTIDLFAEDGEIGRASCRERV